ncbi:MAG: hypothetical protein GX277_07790 [Bacteroidales bacterium]|nr:hypothetical protein [Bacteroidales bacterium]
MRVISLLLCLSIGSVAVSQVYYHTDFETNPVGTSYERAVWAADGFNPDTWDNGLGTRTYLDNSTSVSGTKSLRVTYPAGEFGTGPNGTQIPLLFAPQNEVYMSYWLKFSDNFSWGTTSEGGKLPGLAGGQRCSGCATCTGSNGFSARLMWRPGGQAVLYLYHMDKVNACGDNLNLVYPSGNNVIFNKGEWYHIMQRVRVNSNGSTADGEVEVWVNGQQVLLTTGYRFTSNGDKVDNLYFSTFHGGSDASWAPTETCYTWFDDVKISSNPEDVKYKKCIGPDLGPNTSLCGVSSVELNAHVSETNATFQWIKDNVTLGTSANLTVTTPGTYVLIYDSLGCIQRDTIIVSLYLQPNLGADKEICNTSFEMLDAQDSGVGYTYIWEKDGAVILGATNRTYSAFQAGKYGVTVSAPGCADAYDEITLTSGLLHVPNVSGNEGQSVTITVQETGENYGWFLAPEGGSTLASSSSYTTTIGAANSFLYVQDLGGFTGLVGKKNAAITYTDNRFDRRMKFEVFRNLSIDSITIYVVAQQNVTINILDENQANILFTKTWTNVPAGEQRIALHAQLTAGTYYMDAMGSTGSLRHSYEADTDISFPYTIDGLISILGSNLAWIDDKPYYLFFYNWRVSAGNTCARTPVLLEKIETPVGYEYEAEDATLTNMTVVTTPAGYSGTGAAKMDDTGSVSFVVSLPESGSYNAVLRVATPNGNKDQDLYVNGAFYSTLKFPAHANYFDFSMGTLFLQGGTNTIEIRANWGWMTFDKLTLSKAEPIDYTTVTENLIDTLANAKTVHLYKYLTSEYGSNIISGQTAYWNELIALSSKSPVVRCFDFQSYTQGYSYVWDNATNGHTFGWFDNGATQEAIDWYNETHGKGIVSFQWHWHSPNGGTAGTNTFYTNSTTFNASLSVIPGTTEYTNIIKDIDSIASQLKRLDNAGIPVLWRPLHEAGGAWFWWGAQGAAVCLQLYDILYDRLTNYHNLHNLIWVWSTPEEDWYPGNAKVDIIGYDSYPGAYNYATQKTIFDQLYAIVEGEKMIAMTENGPIPNIDDCIEQDAMWLYFSSWSDLVAEQNTPEHIQTVFAHKNVITLDDVIHKTTQTISLEQGWNLISISVSVQCVDNNLNADSCKISTIFENCDVEVVKNTEGFWKANQADKLNSLHSLEPNKGYLVYMNTNATIEITGIVSMQSVSTLPLQNGWNMIGYPCAEESLQPIIISDYFNATNCKTIKNFNGFWEPNNSMNSIQKLYAGEGYFLYK